jgi:hypothetical protein
MHKHNHTYSNIHISTHLTRPNAPQVEPKAAVVREEEARARAAADAARAIKDECEADLAEVGACVHGWGLDKSICREQCTPHKRHVPALDLTAACSHATS